MKKNLKFFNLMSKLNEGELAGFEKYLKMEYEKEGNALKVFNYYRRFFPGKEHPLKMSLGYAFRKIYDRAMLDEKKDSKNLWNAFSKLNQWLRDFLILEKVREDAHLTDMTWLNILLEKGLTSEYSKSAIQVHQANAGRMLFDLESCLRQMEALQHFRHQLVKDRANPDLFALAACLLEIKKSADLISHKMQCEYLSLKLPAQETSTLKSDQPLLQIYREILQLRTTAQEQHYFEVEKLLQAFGKKIASDESVLILRHMQNYASKMMQQKDSIPWVIRYHDLNKSLLEKGAYLSQGSMSTINFQNIINTACAASDTDWAQQFMDHYAEYLPPKIRAQSLTLAYSTIAFELGNFGRVMELTGRSKFKGDADKVRSKILLLKAMYELGIDVSERCHTYTAYLSRHHKTANGPWQSVIAFMKIFTLLAQGKIPKKDLKKAFDDNKQIPMRSWLDKKIQDYHIKIYQVKKP